MAENGNGSTWLKVAVPIVMIAASSAGVGIWWVAQLEAQVETGYLRLEDQILETVKEQQQARRDLQVALTADMAEVMAHRAELAHAILSDMNERQAAINSRLDRYDQRMQVYEAQLLDLTRRLQRLEDGTPERNRP